MSQRLTAESINGVSKEFSLKGMAEMARTQVAQEQIKAHEANQEAQQLELELRQAQIAHEQKERAEEKGKESKEKVNEVVGG